MLGRYRNNLHKWPQQQQAEWLLHQPNWSCGRGDGRREDLRIERHDGRLLHRLYAVNVGLVLVTSKDELGTMAVVLV